MNRFLRRYRGEMPDIQPPLRVYVRLAEVERDKGGRSVSLFECIDADWFDGGGAKASAGDTSKWPVSVLEAGPIPRPLMRLGGPLIGAAWWQLRSGGPLRMRHYLNLHAAPQERDFSILPAGPVLSRSLDDMCSLDDIKDSSADEIRDALRGVGTVSAAVVYDCGQGNWNALVGSSGAPTLYFDCGAGVLRHASSTTSALTEASICADPVVVLSHWDWDHWAFATTDHRYAAGGGPVTCTWIVPRQRMGAVHRAFLGQLTHYGKVMVWPRGLTTLGVGSIRIERCTGKGRGRNHTGLAMIASDGGGQEMLFPGDARYSAIPSVASGSRFLSVVASHHGADYPMGGLRSSGVGHGRVAYSYGHGNYYGHPIPAMQTRLAAQWPTALETCFLRGSAASPVGHIEMHWSARAAGVSMPAGCTCNNAPALR